MRSIDQITEDIQVVKRAISEACREGDDVEAELLYIDLEELLDELQDAKTATI